MNIRPVLTHSHGHVFKSFRLVIVPRPSRPVARRDFSRLSDNNMTLVCATLLVSVTFLAPVTLRSADSTDTANLRIASLLVADGILKPEGPSDLAILSAALQRDMQERFTQRNRNENALILAENEEGEIVGVVGIDVQRLSNKALNEDRTGIQDQRLSERPLLSSLAVSPKYRRRGIAKKLCREAERTAKRWGYDEVLLKVEADNSRARSLYRSLGYRVVDTDKQAERPVVKGGLRFVKTTQVAMRKSLTFPPLDSVVSALAVAAAAAYASATYHEQLALALDTGAQAGRLLGAGDLEAALALIRRVRNF